MRAALLGAAGTPRLAAPPIKHNVLNELLFTAASQFTRLSGAGGASTDVTNPPGGQTSTVRFANTTSTGGVFVTTLASAWDLSSSIFRFSVRIANYNFCRSVTVRLAETAATYSAGNYVSRNATATTGASNVGNWFPAATWVNDSFVPQAETMTGTVNLANIKYVVFLVSEVSGQSTTVDVSRIQSVARASTRPKCVIWHDDLVLSGGSLIKGKLDAYGWAGSEACELGMVGAGTVFFSAADVAAFRAAGWTMASHAHTSSEHIAQQADNVLDQARRNRLQANRLGYGEEPADFTWWGGLNSAAAYEAIRSAYRSGRWNTSNLIKVETQPPGEPWMTKSLLATDVDTFAANWQPYLTTAIASGGIAQFTLHQMAANSAIAAEFDKLLTWLDQNRASIDVTTIAGALAASVT